MTAPLWTGAEAAAATGARPSGPPDWQARGVSIDSRTVQQGDLFVALVGPNFDGHQFVAQALADGAAAALVGAAPPGVAPDAPLLTVDDTEAGLAALAAAARDRAPAKRIGITGSVGKTGTKDATAGALAGQGRTHATVGNLNNQIGTPLTLARMPADSQFAVLELGMNHAGELTELSHLARPHVAVITAIGAVHLEFFDTVAEIALAKAEIFTGLEAGGTAILNRDDAQFATLHAAAIEATVGDIVTFGAHGEADIQLAGCIAEPDGTLVSARLAGRTIDYRIAIPGRHWAINSLSVLGAVAAVGADLDRAAASFADLTADKGRGRISRMDLDGGGDFLMVDDTYNANPVSMRAAFATLGTLPPGKGGRRIAVLGDMLELGARGENLHRGLACGLKETSVDLVFCAGPHMASLYDALPAALRGAHAATSAALAPHVATAVRPGDVVLIKGSASMAMGTVIAALEELRSAGRSA